MNRLAEVHQLRFEPHTTNPGEFHNKPMKHFLSIADLTPDELNDLLGQ
jgi:hypothetical protein